MKKVIEIIKDSRLYCPTGVVSKQGYLVIGYGRFGPEVYKGMVMNKNHSNGHLTFKLKQIRKRVESMVPSLPSNKIEALSCLVYVCGEEVFAYSSLVRKLNRGSVVSYKDFKECLPSNPTRELSKPVRGAYRLFCEGDKRLSFWSRIKIWLSGECE